MIVGCYTVNLYCDDEGHEGFIGSTGSYYVKVGIFHDEVKHEFAGQNERECFAQARRIGWEFTRDRRVICPFCQKRATGVGS